MELKYGICQWCMPGDGMYAPKLAAEAGWDGVQLDLGTYERGMALTQRGIQEGLLEDAQRYSITYPSLVVNAVTVHSMSKNRRDSSEGQIVYELIRKGVEVTAAMGIEAIMLPCFFESYIHTEEEFQNTAEAFRYCCELSRDKGIDVYVESILPAGDQIRMVEELKMPNLYVFYDTQNYDAFSDLDQLDMIKAFHPYMGKQFHVKDGCGTTSNRMVGEGHGRVFETLNYIREKGFSGWVISENFYDKLPIRLRNEADQMAVSREDLAVIKRALEG